MISFDHDIAAEGELAYHLQARALEIRERIYRPFLFLVIHQELARSTLTPLRPFVQEHTATCLRLIRQWNIRHRHHGTWLMIRQSFASALLLVAARKAGLSEVSEEQCEEAVQMSLSTLRYWEKEAPDLRASRLILEDIVQALDMPILTG